VVFGQILHLLQKICKRVAKKMEDVFQRKNAEKAKRPNEFFRTNELEMMPKSQKNK